MYFISIFFLALTLFQISKTYSLLLTPPPFITLDKSPKNEYISSRRLCNSQADLEDTLKLPKTKTKGHLINKQTDIHYYINWISYGHYHSFITQLEINMQYLFFFAKN